MRTTIDLSPELMRAAKVRAAQRGESLKELFSRAIAHEVRRSGPARREGRVTLPLIRSRGGPKVNITSADIEGALAAEDAERYAG